ncbi:RraA-like protein, partial [Amniculicola lignicola CBS 123094]
MFSLFRRTMSTTSGSRWKELSKYSACDVADALLKLKVPGAGFLVDISPIPTQSNLTSPLLSKIIAPASTVLMIPKASPSFPTPQKGNKEDYVPSNIEPGVPYADLIPPDSIVLISQPPRQACAVMGGIMAARMKHLGAKAVVVDGRVRDLATLAQLSDAVPVWSKGTSIIGAGAESKFHAIGVPVQIGEVVVEEGDIVMVDLVERGVVVVPRGRVEEVLGLLPGLVGADERVMGDVEAGVSVREAFARHRS